MNVLFLSFEDLRYDALSSAGNSKINTYVFDSFVNQGQCFHNFRVPTPHCEENLNAILESFEDIESDRELYFSKESNEDTFDYLKKKVDRNDFFIWKHFYNHTLFDFNSVDYNGYVLFLQDHLRQFMDWMDEHGFINEDTMIVLVGLNGRHSDDYHAFKIFKDKNCTLYDDHLHVPFIIFHPDYSTRDIANSVSVKDLGSLMKFFIDGNESPASKLLDPKDGTDKQYRSDIYSYCNGYGGLRGPMFQYYCKYDENKIVTGQEFYDLNNDYSMRSDLFQNVKKINPQYIEMINTYRERVVHFVNAKE